MIFFVCVCVLMVLGKKVGMYILVFFQVYIPKSQGKPRINDFLEVTQETGNTEEKEPLYYFSCKTVLCPCTVHKVTLGKVFSKLPQLKRDCG